MATNPYFYGLEGGKLFKIYVTNNALYGALIANGPYDEASARAVTMHFGLIGWIIARQIGKKAVAKRAEKEALYDNMDVQGSQFLTMDKANFTFSGGSLPEVTVSEKRTGLVGIVTAQPAVEIVTPQGKKRKFILIGDQNTTEVKNLLSRATTNVTMKV